jgi:hypothetical protein
MNDFQIRKWYFGVNRYGIIKSEALIKAAVNSCLANTPLAPHLLYYGEETRQVADLRKMGVKVINHTSSLEPELQVGYGPRYPKFAGHWLRADLPLVETEDQYILYTDIDVLFLNWRPELLAPPRYLAAAPEHRLNERRTFNSGVMVMNLEGMRAELPQFHAAIRHRLLNNFKYPNHDQRSFNDFFKGRFDHLDPLMNWKPYWGRNSGASIIHFHGPKPKQVEFIKAGLYTGKRDLNEIWARNPGAYDYYCPIWDQYAVLQKAA